MMIIIIMMMMIMMMIIIIIIIHFVFGATAPSGPGPPHSRGF